MKPHLPLTLLSALLVLGASRAPAATIVNPSPADFSGSGSQYTDNELIVNTDVYVPEYSRIGWYAQAGSNTLSGSGSVNAILDAEGYSESELYVVNMTGDKCSVVVNGVAFNGMSIDITDVDIAFNNTMKDPSFIIWHDSVVDLTNAKMSGWKYFEFADDARQYAPSVMLPPGGTLNISPSGMLGVGDNGIIRGNVNLNGPYSVTQSSPMPPIHFFDGHVGMDGYSGWGTLNIEGALTLGSATAIGFDGWGDEGVTGALPDSRHPLIICSSLSGSLKRLVPYVWVEADDDSYIRLTNYGFRAEKGADGRIYIYLTPASELPPEEEPVTPPEEEPVTPPEEEPVTPPEEEPVTPPEEEPVTPVPPTHVAHEAASGNTIILSGDDVISADSMVKLNGGSADVSAVSSPLTNESIIGTSSGGTLITADTQQMDFTRDGDVNYALSGKGGHAAAAMMVKNDVTLRGSHYDSDKITVERGVLTVGEKTTLGRGNASLLLVKSKATNMGNVAAHTVVEQHAAVLNMGMMSGDVDLKNGAVLTNNATVKGRVVAEGGSSVFGTGAFADTLVQSGAHLHVGNSPGYQHHASLTLQRGSNLSFSVDGVTPATLTQTGSGTHSRMVADKLTLSGTPTVTVEVTMGYVHDLLAGKNGTVTLMSVGSGDSLTALKDAVTIHDTTGYLEDLQVYADAAELSISAVLNEAAETLHHSQEETEVVCEPSVDTMWASRDIVRSFARTAEGQMIIGTPGQTTVWGAALGSFVHMSRSTGFVAENGGGAIGVQHAFTEQFRAGAAFGQTFGSFRTKESYMNADRRGTMFGAVAQYVGREQNGVSASLNGHIAIGSVRNEAKFNSDFSGCGKSSWDDRVLSLGTRASLWMNPSTDVTLAPFIGLEYQRVIQGHHTESDGTYSVRYSGGAMQTLSLPVGVTLRTQCMLPDGETLVPEITLAYEGDVVRQNPHVTVREAGATGRCKGTGSKPGRSALRLDAGVNLLIDAQWSVGAFYHLEARKDATSHSCNAAVRYSF